MTSRRSLLLLSFPVGNDYMIGVYQGSLSQFDIIVKYRQKENGRWSRLRTPKHIHWAVDIIIKQHMLPAVTQLFIDELIVLWNQTNPMTSLVERNQFLNTRSLLQSANAIARNYQNLNGKGEYSVEFLCVLAILLMRQEKTNNPDAYMFKNLLEALKAKNDIFKIVSVATHS
mgnify:FL=1